jgi:hypothetical protein
MIHYDEFLKKREKTLEKKSRGFTSYNDFQTKRNIPKEKAAMQEQGLPVSVRKDRAQPTFVGGILRSAAKGLGGKIVASTANVPRILRGEEPKESFKTKYLGEVKPFKGVDITKSPFTKENLVGILDAASTGAEIASYLSAANVGKKTITELTKRGVLANKATFAEWIAKMYPQLAKEGAIQGTAYTLGTQGQEYVESGKKPSAMQATKDIITSTIGNIVIPTVMRGAGTSSQKILKARRELRAIEDAKILGKKIPDVGVPPPKQLPAGRIQLPEAGILESQAKLRQTQPVESVIRTPKIAKEVTEPVGGTQSQEFTSINKWRNTQKIAQQAKKPEYQKVVQSMASDVERIMDDGVNIDDYAPGTFEVWSSEIRQLPIEEIRNVAMGGEKTILNNVPENAYLSVMKNIAEETGDVQLVKELAMSNVASRQGQGLVASRMTRAGNVVDDLRQIRLQRLKNINVDEKTLMKEQKSLFETVKKNITDFAKISKQEANDIIRSLICK